jgi:hypothetical protein
MTGAKHDMLLRRLERMRVRYWPILSHFAAPGPAVEATLQV